MKEETILLVGMGGLALGGLLLLNSKNTSAGRSTLVGVGSNNAAAAQIEESRLQAGSNIFQSLTSVLGQQQQAESNLKIAQLQADVTKAGYATEAAIAINNQQSQSSLANAQLQAQLEAINAQSSSQDTSTIFNFATSLLGTLFPKNTSTPTAAKVPTTQSTPPIIGQAAAGSDNWWNSIPIFGQAVNSIGNIFGSSSPVQGTENWMGTYL